MLEVKIILKKVLITALIIIVAFILQTSVFSNFELAGVTPNIILIVTSYLGFFRGRKSGIIVGFSCGLLLDLFFDSYFGVYALSFMLIGYLNGVFRKLIFVDEILFSILIVALSDLLYGIGNYFVFLFNKRTSFIFYLFNLILPEVIYTVVIAFFLYFIIYHLSHFMDKGDGKKGDLDFAWKA